MKVQLIEHREGVVHYQGDATMIPIKNGIEIQFVDGAHMYSWKVYEQGVIIRSISDVEVILTCKPQRRTQGHIDTEYGRIDLEIETEIYHNKTNQIELKYDLIQNEQRQTFHFTLSMKEETSDVH